MEVEVTRNRDVHQVSYTEVEEIAKGASRDEEDMVADAPKSAENVVHQLRDPESLIVKVLLSLRR